jgi:phosphomannomutase
MKNNKIHFGFESWRGLSDSEINFKRIAKVAQAFADFLISHSNEKDILKVGIGYDGRDKSKDFALLFSRVLSGNNLIVFFTDKISPTPALTCFVKENNLNAGIIITGGRFPSEYNGVKFISSYGSILSKEQLNEIENFIDKDLIQANEDKVYQTDIKTKYYEMLEGLVDFNSIKESGINFLIDSMGGAGQQILENLLIINDIQSKTIFKFSENNFSGRIPNPVKENLQPVINEVKKSEDFSFAVAMDGDADRVVFISDKGDLLDDNQTALLLTDYILKTLNASGGIIKSFIHTEKLNNFAGRNKVTEVPVGLRFFFPHILSENFPVGFEGNGGFIWGKGTPYRDGILSALIFSEMVAKSGYKKLSDYLDSKIELFSEIYTGELNIKSDKPKGLNYLCENPPDKICNFSIKSFHSFKESNDELNSLKISFDGERRWVVIRKSDHYPLLKLYAEGNSTKEVQEILNETSVLLNK